MKEKLTIIKVGGGIVEDDLRLQSVIDAFVAVEGAKILVHGGGKVASQLAKDLGIDVQMIDGRRVTNDEMIDVVIMTYGGLINKKLVALLSANNEQGIGLTGADGDCIRSSKRPMANGLDYGWVGDIERVNVQFFHELLQKKMIPVVAPLTHDGNGNLLNTNADTIASEVGASLSGMYDVSINFIFDLPGVMENVEDHSSLIKSIDRQAYTQLRSRDVITDGMIPKLDNAFAALDQGISLVRLLDISGLKELNNPDYDEFTIIH